VQVWHNYADILSCPNGFFCFVVFCFILRELIFFIQIVHTICSGDYRDEVTMVVSVMYC